MTIGTKKMEHNPIDHFDSIRHLFDYAGLTTTPINPSSAEDEKAAWDMLLDELNGLRTERSEFFDRFNYDWAFKESSYTDMYEALLQIRTIKILSEISIDHPQLKNARPICIRFINTNAVNSMTYFSPNFSYILFPRGLAIFMRNFAMFALDLVEIGWAYKNEGRSYEKAGVMDYEMTDFIYGDVINRAIIFSNQDVYLKSAKFFIGLLRICLDRTNTYEPKVGIDDRIDSVSKSIGDRRVVRIWPAVLDAEMFVVCHELAHCLKHREVERKGNFLDELTLEREADDGGASLFIIYKAVYKNPMVVFPAGPALFFRLTDMYISMRLMASRIGSRKDMAVQPNIADFLLTVRERQKMFRLSIRKYFDNDRLGGLYVQYVREMNVIVAWMRTFFTTFKENGDQRISKYKQALANENDWRVMAYPTDVEDKKKGAAEILDVIRRIDPDIEL